MAKSPAQPGNSAPSGVQSTGGKGDRQQFNRYELATVMSHYEVGIIEAIQEFPRGSRKAPKLVIRTTTGTYLLKRRAPGKEDARKVAFCHEIQLFLAAKQFPLPHLIGTKQDNNSMLQIEGYLYELFEYIKGTAYDTSLEATQDAGKTLALFHKLLLDFESDYDTAVGSYHGSKSVITALERIPDTLARKRPDAAVPAAEIDRIVQFIYKSYKQASDACDQQGLPDWPAQITHSDWHPGNMLFRGNRVVAVIDYDSSRFHQRVSDVANGALQFSILGGGEDPDSWPDYLDISRYKRFLRAYDQLPGAQLSKAEIDVVPDLMVQALIAESAIPIATQGMIGRMCGASFLTILERKVRWLQDKRSELAAVLDS